MSDNIYDYLKENFNINVTDYQFKRDYIKEPLIKRKLNNICYKLEYPIKEDVEFLFLTLNLTRNDVTKLLNISKTSLSRITKKYSIQKSEQLYEINAKNKINDILSTNPSLYKNNQIKAKKTKLEKYGDENYSNRKKSIETCLKKYGVKNVFQHDKIKEKSKNTLYKTYGVSHNMHIPECILLIKKTKLEKYGDENYNNREKMKETNIKLFGVDSYSKTKEYKKYMSNPIIKRNKLLKEIETRRKNGTLGKSISSKETKWLDSLGIPNDNMHRQVLLSVNNVQYIVDGFNPETNTVYEFLGDYWHGNPETQIMENINVQRGVTFQKLYDDTISKLNNLKSKYNVIYIWENDWK